MGGYLSGTVILHLSGVSHKLWCLKDFASYLLILKRVIHKTIKKLIQLCYGDGVDVAVVYLNLYLVRLCLYAVNSKEVRCEERTIYHWAPLPWFTIFNRCA